LLALVVGVDHVATLTGELLPPTRHALAAAGLGLATGALLLPSGVRAATLAALVGLLLGAALFFVPLSPRKSFVRAVQRLTPGMARGQASAIMDRFERGHPNAENPLYRVRAGPRVDAWHHGRGGQLIDLDHCYLVYDADDRLLEIDLHLD
jgi:hypothetical protein